MFSVFTRIFKHFIHWCRNLVYPSLMIGGKFLLILLTHFCMPSGDGGTGFLCFAECGKSMQNKELGTFLTGWKTENIFPITSWELLFYCFRLFVTHCGVHGVLEAIYHKVTNKLNQWTENTFQNRSCRQIWNKFQVPMVGMPVFIDQGDVMRRYVW